MTITLGKPLTAQQAALLRYLWAYQKQHGYPPIRREICRHFGWTSSNAPSNHLKPLVQKGYLRHDPAKSRGYVALRGPGLPVVEVENILQR